MLEKKLILVEGGTTRLSILSKHDKTCESTGPSVRNSEHIHSRTKVEDSQLNEMLSGLHALLAMLNFVPEAIENGYI